MTVEGEAVTTKPAGADLRKHLDRLSALGVVGNLSDGSLLAQIVHEPGEEARAAFTVLVERHGPMVLGVCRQTLGNSHDADDAFQGTFMVLARKASSVRKADSVASWLHGVALRVAKRARTEVARRAAYERRSASMKPKKPDHAEGLPDSCPELHEEIARLPRHYREPVVLCYLEGLSAEVAAQRLGCPRGTVLSRLSRAKDQLRARLIRRGIASPAVLLFAETLPDAPAMPSALLEATVKTSLSFMSHSSTAMALGATKPAVLAKGVLHAMLISKLKAGAILALSGCGIAYGAVALTYQEKAAAPPAQVPESKPSAQPEDRNVARPPQAPQAKPNPDPDTRDAISFQKLALSTDDLVEATGLDVYKFRIDIRKGEKFRVVLRSQERKETPSHEIIGYSFEKTSDDPATIGVSFLRLDRKLSGFLLSNEAQAEYRLSCSHCKPGGLATFVNNPLGFVDSTRRTILVFRSVEETKDHGAGAGETLLLRVCETKAARGVDVDGYPRAELVVVKDR